MGGDVTHANLRRRALLTALCASPLAALAQGSAVELIVPFAPGGLTDVVARMVGEVLARELAQPVVVKNVVGAGGNIAFAQVARSRPDGHTIGLLSLSAVTNSILRPGSGYDPLASFTPIGMGCVGGTLIVSHPSLPARTLPELIALAKAKPGTISYGTSGVGGGGHLAAELLQAAAGIELIHVPYKGGNQAAADLAGGQIPLLFSSMATAIPHVEAGRIHALATTSAARASALPKVPTVAELGFAGYEASVWFAMVGPAGLPEPIVRQVNAALNQALADPQVQEMIRKQGYEPGPGTPQACAAQIRADHAKWGKVIRDANIRFS